jgi:hypothetical protein
MRTMKLKERQLNFDSNGTVSLNRVMGNRFRKNGYSHIQYKGDVYPCSTVKFDIIPNKIVWVDGLQYRKIDNVGKIN